MQAYNQSKGVAEGDAGVAVSLDTSTSSSSLQRLSASWECACHLLRSILSILSLACNSFVIDTADFSLSSGCFYNKYVMSYFVDQIYIKFNQQNINFNKLYIETFFFIVLN